MGGVGEEFWTQHRDDRVGYGSTGFRHLVTEMDLLRPLMRLNRRTCGLEAKHWMRSTLYLAFRNHRSPLGLLSPCNASYARQARDKIRTSGCG